MNNNLLKESDKDQYRKGGIDQRQMSDEEVRFCLQINLCCTTS